MAEEYGGRSQAGRKASEGGRGQPEKASPAAIERYLKGIGFPATKDELIEQAQDNGAPQDVMKVLDQFDDKEYQSVADVAKEIGKLE